MIKVQKGYSQDYVWNVYKNGEKIGELVKHPNLCRYLVIDNIEIGIAYSEWQAVEVLQKWIDKTCSWLVDNEALLYDIEQDMINAKTKEAKTAIERVIRSMGVEVRKVRYQYDTVCKAIKF